MKIIIATTGEEIFVDDDDYEKMSIYKWSVWRRKGYVYALRNCYIDGKKTTSRMHREIIGLKRYDERLVDHINHNGLDNRKINLRIVCSSENNINHKKRVDNISGHSGVQFHKISGFWYANIWAYNKKYYLGCFKSKEKAVEVRKKAEKFYHGQYSKKEED